MCRLSGSRKGMNEARETMLWGLAAFFLLVNLTAFLIMLADKVRSRRGNAERISEGLLFFLATAFGSVGVYVGMFAFRHKTRKWYFLIGIPLLILQNLACLYVASVLFMREG
jgi:uncharacterized membrane protein YsdA (DUF1294 family)